MNDKTKAFLKHFTQNWAISFLIIVILFSRLLIFNKDASGFWADEGRYPLLITNLADAAKSGDLLLPIQRLFNIDARPGAGLFYYPPAFLEMLNSNIPFSLYYNLIVNSLILILIFFVIKKTQGIDTAFVATLLITLSLSSLVYIRHTLPYDIALLLLLLGLYFYVYFKRVFLFGVFAGLSFLTYPSYYYYLIPIPLVLFLFERTIKKPIFFIAGIFLVFITTQIFSQAISAPSYFKSLQEQSGGVTAIGQGDYLPAAGFITEYILAVDGYFNLLLILCILPALFLIKQRNKVAFFIFYLLAVFLILEVFSHILQRHVLYGRTVRPLYLIALGLSGTVFVKAFSNFKNKKIYIAFISFLIILCIINWLPKFLVYKNISYPKQFQQKARDYLNSKYPKYEIEDALFVNYWDTKSPDPKLVWHFFKPGEKSKYYTMNAIQTYPYYGNLNMAEFCKYEVILKEPHIQYRFKPYLLEGHKKAMRDIMANDPLYYQLIRCN